tara:strand:+ start:4289 stop:4462 length:174 start_codon:yes stop_codon:yes gene_type:complete
MQYAAKIEEEGETFWLTFDCPRRKSPYKIAKAFAGRGSRVLEVVAASDPEEVKYLTV